MSGYERLRHSLLRLEEQYENWTDSETERTRLDREAVRESVTRRFKICYDCLWKALKRHLVHELGISDAPSSPKPILRIAAENDLLSTRVQQWFRYADTRVATAHDYDGAKAEACVELVPEFLSDAVRLYETLTGESWECVRAAGRRGALPESRREAPAAALTGRVPSS